jgi:2-polyprenyl-6-hydroxyphenyl methylase/3-demethylubiquinone-9 3-methyltransferase
MIAPSATLDPAEIERFSRVASEWWDEAGPFAPLHRLNPVRLRYIRDRIAAHYSLQTARMRPLHGLRILDVGCGGGLVAEPLARMGAAITAIDADETAIGIARAHARDTGADIDYRVATIDALAENGRTYDVVLALEIIEHVAGRDTFMRSLGGLVSPGGLLIMSTLNRTAKSYVAAIIGAEYVLRWLPRGTHDWRKFIRPSELARLAGHHGFSVEDISGLAYDPLWRQFRLDQNNVAVNYFMTFASLAAKYLPA